MNYEEMSDFEINKRVAETLGYEYVWSEKDSFNNTGREGALTANRLSGHGIIELNYCNNPSDAWPIIVENKISLKFRSGTDKLNVMAEYDNQTYSVHSNPLRAAMIVYLMMQESA